MKNDKVVQEKNRLQVFDPFGIKTLDIRDEPYINETLMKHLINKKLKKATYIKSIKYAFGGGCEIITINHDNGYKSIYYIY